VCQLPVSKVACCDGAERSLPDWWLTKDGDKSCLELYQRHYSAEKAYKDGRERHQFVGPGSSIVLRTLRADALFVWREYIDDTIPKQHGIECAVFRNESAVTSSDLIRQADAIADRCWPDRRHYTKVRAEAIRSTNPGYCFQRSGWRRCGMTQGGLIILERRASPPAHFSKESPMHSGNSQITPTPSPQGDEK
jgi:hypothetical protein